MNKLLISAIAMIAMLAASIPSAQAVTATGTFNVNITLTSGCSVDTATLPTAANFTYTAFQVAAATFATSFDILCTNTLPIVSVALDSLAVTDAATNLAYTLVLGASPATGTGVAQAITVNGSMAGGQAGTCAAASCTNALSANKTRTVTVTY